MKEKTKKRLKISALVILCVLLIYIVLALSPRPQNFKGDNPMMKEGDKPLLIAHGGGNGEFPDNTLEAFYNAYDADKNVMMETDVSITKDGVVILSHDVTIDRKTNRTGEIANWNYTDLISERVDFGYTNETEDGKRLNDKLVHFVGEDGNEKYPTDVPGYPDGLPGRDKDVFLATTLEDLLRAFPDNRVNVEIKQSGTLGLKCLDEVLKIIEREGAFDRVVLASFHDEIYSEFIRLKAKVEVPDNLMFSPGVGGVVRFYILHLTAMDLFFTDELCVLQLPTEEYGLNLATAELVNTAHRHNFAVHYWTIDDPDEMRHLIEIGADGIMTNYPHRLKGVYTEMDK